jgi:hypothetical protein
MNEKSNLRHDLEGWRGRQFTDEEAEDFDTRNVLGKPCMINVIHKPGKKGKTYANIAGIAGLPKSASIAPIVSSIPPIYYGPDETDTYQQLPQWIREKIDTQIIVKKEEPKDERWSDGQGPLEGGTYVGNDDIPF